MVFLFAIWCLSFQSSTTAYLAAAHFCLGLRCIKFIQTRILVCIVAMLMMHVYIMMIMMICCNDNITIAQPRQSLLKTQNKNINNNNSKIMIIIAKFVLTQMFAVQTYHLQLLPLLLRVSALIAAVHHASSVYLYLQCLSG